jgi:hypothetical protein
VDLLLLVVLAELPELLPVVVVGPLGRARHQALAQEVN